MAAANIFIRLCTTSVLGFVISASLALYEQWRMQELCWGFWITGLLYCWGYVGIGCIRIILPSGHHELLQAAREKIPLRCIQTIPPPLFSLAVTIFSVIIGYIAFYVYAYLFSFYGLFLSVFAETEPRTLFGRNGFINSDFFTPVAYLAQLCWPMALGSILADREYLLKSSPLQILLKPFSRQVLIIHVAVLIMPFVALLSWMLLKDSYQPVTVVFLLAIFYFLPRETDGKTGA
ncbi:MAG: hypothetical protein JW832_18175 [Deltaproteobacteria bacterium]|nr:hypothetical protein [Deltaproteobacteria bacterium]